MSKENKNTAKKSFFLTRWLKRMFIGERFNATDVMFVEKIESPSVMAVKAFFRRKLAVVALVVLIAMFLLVFLGPLAIPMDLNYTDPLQKNISPNYTMLSVPDELADDVKTISSFSCFSVGVSNSGSLYLWGNTYDSLSKIDLSEEIPAEIQAGNVVTASAGYDHIMALTADGKLIGWGNKTVGQYGYLRKADDAYVQMPEKFIEGTLELSKVDQLLCGYQVTGLVYDGQLYMWGNPNAMLSLKDFINV